MKNPLSGDGGGRGEQTASVCRFSGGRGQPEVNAFHFKHTLGWGGLNSVGPEIGKAT